MKTMSSTKPEVYNVLQCCHRRTEAQPQATCTKNGVVWPCLLDMHDTHKLVTITYLAFNYDNPATEVNSHTTWMLENGRTKLAYKSTITSENLNLMTQWSISELVFVNGTLAHKRSFTAITRETSPPQVISEDHVATHHRRD